MQRTRPGQVKVERQSGTRFLGRCGRAGDVLPIQFQPGCLFPVNGLPDAERLAPGVHPAVLELDHAEYNRCCEKSYPACRRPEERCRSPGCRPACQEYHQPGPGVAPADSFTLRQFAFQALDMTLEEHRIGHLTIPLLIVPTFYTV